MIVVCIGARTEFEVNNALNSRYDIVILEDDPYNEAGIKTCTAIARNKLLIPHFDSLGWPKIFPWGKYVTYFVPATKEVAVQLCRLATDSNIIVVDIGNN